VRVSWRQRPALPPAQCSGRTLHSRALAPAPTAPPPQQRGKYSDVSSAAAPAKKEAAPAAEGGEGAPAAAAAAAAAPAAAPAAAAAAPAAAAAAPVKPGAWVPKAPAEGGGGESKFGGGKKCAACTKAVYPAEPKVEADGKIWHATCFKCLECASKITLSSWSQLEGRNYCKP
jgi:hypothetical protein